MPFGIAHQHEARVVGDLPPFMEVEGDGVGALDALEQGLELRRHHSERAYGAVDVEMQAIPGGDFRQHGQVVDGAGVHRASRAHQQERLKAGGPVLRDGLFDGHVVHGPGRIGVDQPQAVRAETGHFHGARNAVVGRLRGVGSQSSLGRRHALEARRQSEGSGPGDQHGHEVGHRGAGDEEAAGGLRQAGQLGHPAGDLAFDLDRRLPAAAEVGIEAGGQHLGGQADHRAGPVHPAHEAGVQVAGLERHDVAKEIGVDVGEGRRTRRSRRGETWRTRGRRRTPHRAVPHPLDVVQDVVQHGVRLGAERRPVPGVQIVFAREIGRHASACDSATG